MDSLLHLAGVFTHCWIFLRCFRAFRDGSPFASSVVKTLAAMSSSLHHIQLAVLPQEVGTRGARLPITTLRRVLGIDGSGLSNSCAQTLGQHTSNVPEFCFDVPPRTACRCPELDPLVFADPALRVSNASISLVTAHISTHKRGGIHCRVLDRRAPCFAASGAQWRKGTQEISLAHEHGDGLLYTDSLTSFPGYVLCRDVEASRRRSRKAWVSARPHAVRLNFITLIFNSLSWLCSHGRGKLC